MKSEDGYNGYANYETWSVALWLGNEESSYRYWRAAAAEEKRHAPHCRQVRDDVWPREEAAKYRLADRIKEEVNEQAPDLAPSLYSDLMHAALSEVDWQEVADVFLEE